MRCLRLALRLKSKGHNCKIFTDQKVNNILLNKNIKHFNLYKKIKGFFQKFMMQKFYRILNREDSFLLMIID